MMRWVFLYYHDYGNFLQQFRYDFPFCQVRDRLQMISFMHIRVCWMHMFYSFGCVFLDNACCTILAD